MPLQSPLPSSLPKECAKAAQIFTSFASIIPSDILRNAKGFAILVIAKAGFLFSARAGSGIVLVKLADGSWSAPSAIGTGGLGVGGQAGAELSEFVIILNSRAAVQSFMSAGSVNLGGNLSVAVGPLGRNAEATGSLNKFATMYSYSRTKGLFGGASLEGSVIFERGDANQKAYAGYLDDNTRNNESYYDDDEYDAGQTSSKGGKVSARSLLSGQIPPPPWASTLINSIERRVGTAVEANWINDEPEDMDDRRNRGYSFDTEYAARSSENNDREFGYGPGSGSSGFGKSKSPRDKLAASAKGRLRGYSLGSFGRKASSSTKEESHNQRSRSNTMSGPAYRYNNDSDEDDDERRATRYSNFDQDNVFDTADPYYAEREREKDRATGFSNSDYDLPPSPSSTTSNRSQRLSEFMKRPVMPTRKSTTSARDMKGGGSPLGGLSRNASMRAKNTLGRFGRGGGSNSNSNTHSPTNEFPSHRSRDYFDGERRDRNHDEEEEDEYRNRDRGEDTTASPFADRFSPVTESAFDFDRFRAAGSTENSRASSPSYTGGIASRSTPTRQEKKKPSLLGVATNVLSRPLGKRSATAPIPRRNYSAEEQEEGAAYRTRTPQDDTDDDTGERDYFEFQQRQQRNAASHPSDRNDRQKTSGAGSPSRHYSDDEDDDSDARTAPIAIHRNPFDDSGSHTNTSTDGPRDLLTAHDDDVLSSSLSDVEVPRHRLEALYLKDNHDTRSIRSIDSNTEFTFGDKAHKMVSNDYSGVGNGVDGGSQKQYRMGTFDFDGAEAGDLSFKTGEIIEIINMDDPDWYLGKIGNRQGIIPVNRTRAYKG